MISNLMIDGVTLSKVEACLDATRACGAALADADTQPAWAADKDLLSALQEAARVTKLSAECLERVPDLQDMVLCVCVEICERAALACARHLDELVLSVCGEALAACAAICAGAPEIEMVPSVQPDAPIVALH